MIVIHATFPIDPDRRNEALALIKEVVESSRQEPGMIDYRAAVDVEDRNQVRFIEQYEDEETYTAHSQTDHFQEFEEQLPDVLAGRPEVVRFDVDEASELDL